jgi:ABC-type transporter Mla MlaB component
MESSRKAGFAPPPRVPGNIVALPADCTRSGIGALHDQLRAAGRHDVLDGSAVQRIDAAGLRLLLAFMNERRAAGSVIAWRATSQVLSTAAQELGLTAAMHLPGVRPVS